LPINSVWLWGGGFKPAVPGHPFSAVWGHDALTCALAAAAGIYAAPPPHDAAQWLRSTESSLPTNAEHLLVLGNLESALRRGDIAGWREEISALDRNWFGPLMELLGKRLTRVAIVVPGTGSGQRFELSRRAVLRFWRSNRPVSAYVPPETTG